MSVEQFTRQAQIRWHLPLAFLLVALAGRPALGAEVKKEDYPDGAKHLVYSVDADGLKNGQFKEFYRSGKPNPS